MIIIPELKKIAAANDKIEKLSKIVETKIDTDDLWLKGATLIDGCSEKNGHLFQNGCQLDNGGLTDNTYYCDQHCGYCEDDFYGTLYFKTNVPGTVCCCTFSLLRC